MSNEQEHKSPRESGEDSEDESEILEESPCGRWLKRREEVSNTPTHNLKTTVCQSPCQTRYQTRLFRGQVELT